MRWFVSRHPGAIEWLSRQGIAVDQQIAHLNLQQIQPGDWVLGSLPVNMAAAVCARGARYLHLSLQVPADARGRELSADELDAFGAHLQAFEVRPAAIWELPSDK